MAAGWPTLGHALLGLVLALTTSPSSALELAGPLRQGALVLGQAAPGTRVFFAGRELQVDARGRFVAGLGRDAAPQVPLAWHTPDGGFHLRVLSIAQRRYGVQRISGLPRRMVHPGEPELARIRREQARLLQARLHRSGLQAYRQRFLWPVHGRLTGVYGTRRILNGEPRQPHLGVDIAAPKGTPVRAPAGGVVRLAEPDLFFSGGTLVLDHGHGVTSAFLHLGRFLVAPGDRVARGQTIAEVGATGRVTGAHLDWRVSWLEHRLDPVLLAGPMPRGDLGDAPGPHERGGHDDNRQPSTGAKP